MERRGDSAPRAGIQLARKKQILIFAVADYLGRYLNKEEIHALNTRRKLIIRYIQKLIKVAGEANVLF
jgi:ribosomal protein L17